MQWIPVALACLLPMIWGPAAPASTLYVSPQGNDHWSGQLATPKQDGSDGPLASLEGARNALRQMKTAGKRTGPVHVHIAAGTYRQWEPIVFSAEDSGTKDAPIIYEAAPGAKPVFDAGRRITHFEVNRQGLWVADLPDVRAGKWYF